jgi:head-tail adaptor
MLTQRLRHRITFQKQGAQQQDAASGDVFIPWVDLYTDVPAEVLTGAGRPGSEIIASEVKQAVETDARMTLRWLPDIDASVRVVWDGENYDITSVETDRTARRELRLRCKKGLTDGR